MIRFAVRTHDAAIAETAILNAAFEPDGWQRAVEAVAAATRSSAAQLLGLGGPLLLPLNIVAGSFPGGERHFTNPALHGQCNWRIGVAADPLSIQDERDYAAFRRFNDTAIYDDAVSDLDIPFGCQSALVLDHNGLLGLALLRSARDGRCDPETLDIFAGLRFHFARAVRMQIALDGEGAELMVGDLSRLNGATLLLDRYGSLSALTPAAEPLFEHDGPLRLDGLVPRLCSRSSDRLFQAALAFALGSGENAYGSFHQVRCGCWKIAVMALPRRNHGLGFDPHVAVAVRQA